MLPLQSNLRYVVEDTFPFGTMILFQVTFSVADVLLGIVTLKLVPGMPVPVCELKKVSLTAVGGAVPAVTAVPRVYKSNCARVALNATAVPFGSCPTRGESG